MNLSCHCLKGVAQNLIKRTQQRKSLISILSYSTNSDRNNEFQREEITFDLR